MHISSFWLNVYNDANATYTHAYRMQKYIIESNGAAIGKHGDDRSDQSQYVLYIAINTRTSWNQPKHAVSAVRYSGYYWFRTDIGQYPDSPGLRAKVDPWPLYVAVH